MMTGAYRFPAMESVIYGRPFAEALKAEVERADAHAVFLLASGTLARETGLVEDIRAALGNRLAGVCAKIGAHTPRGDCVAAVNAARAAGADLLVTLGGGSVTDAAKIVAMCLSNDIATRDSSTITAPRSLPTARSAGRRSRRPTSARSRSPPPCRPASTPPRPAAPTPCATSRKASGTR
jgi:maleylacetate reductase